MSMAAAKLRLHQRMVRVLKYRNKPITVDGIRFPSRKQARRWLELTMLAKAGIIRNLRREIIYPMTVHGELITTYRADFVYEDREFDYRTVIEDVKGYQTPEFKIKWKLGQVLYPQYIWRLT